VAWVPESGFTNICSIYSYLAFLVIDSESGSDEEQINLEEQMKTFNMTELVWSLCEILWIDLAPGGLNCSC